MTFNAASAIVADDHELFRAALAEILRREFGFGLVIEAGSLDDAVDLLGRTSNVAFASIDLAMPGMNGEASLLSIREEYPDIRLAVITGSERREDILLALDAGVHGYIPKTLKIAEIAAALRTILEGRIFVPPVLANKAFPSTRRNQVAPAVPHAPPRLSGLSPRQRAVLDLISLGKSNKEIAHELRLAEGTVKVHVSALFRTLGTHNRMGAVAAIARLHVKSARN